MTPQSIGVNAVALVVTWAVVGAVIVVAVVHALRSEKGVRPHRCHYEET